ncbi:hypothetical protein BC829DRAFT_35268 [Chytridium lagenaria]|nr:hypothetical protein BC829DRAFT_35268 [Chytridium lagenaria]
MSLELANLRAENEILRAEAKGVPELSGRLRYLFHAASTSPLMSTLKKWASLGPNASNDEAMEAFDGCSRCV